MREAQAVHRPAPPTVWDRTSLRARANVRATLLLMLVPALLTVVQYGIVPLTDPGVLYVSDDALALNRVRDGLSFERLFRLHADHLVPATYLLHYVVYSLAGVWWPAYGTILLAAHALTCSLVGVVIWRFGHSVTAALAISVPLTLSFSFASGVTSQFINVQFYWVYSSLLLVWLLLSWYLETGRTVLVGLLVLVGALALLVHTVAVLIFPMLAIYLAAFKLASLPADARPAAWLRLGRREAVLAAAGLLLGVCEVVLLAVSVFVLGNRLPGYAEFRPPTPEPQVIRILQAFNYGFLGLLPFAEFDWMPTSLSPYPVVGALSAAIVGFCGLLVAVSRSKRQDHQQSVRAIALVALASVVVAMAYAVLATTGRRALTYEHIRYNGSSVIFSSIAIGLALAIVLARVPARLRRPSVLGVLIASLIVASADVAAVRQSNRFVARQQAGLVYAQHAKPAWTIGGTLVAVPVEAETVVHLSHDVPQAVESNTPTVLSFARMRPLAPIQAPSQAGTGLPALVPGTYALLASVAFEPNQQGIRMAEILVNGRQVAQERVQAAPGGPTVLLAHALYPLDSGDQVEVRVTQSSAQRLDVAVLTRFSPELAMVRLVDQPIPAARAGAIDLDTIFDLGLSPSAWLAVRPDQAIPEDAFTYLALTPATVDPDRFAVVDVRRSWLAEQVFVEHGVDTTRLTARAAGTYLLLGDLALAAHQPGFRKANLTANGRTGLAWNTTAGAGGEQRIRVATVIRLEADDFLELGATTHLGDVR